MITMIAINLGRRSHLRRPPCAGGERGPIQRAWKGVGGRRMLEFGERRKERVKAPNCVLAD